MHRLISSEIPSRTIFFVRRRNIEDDKPTWEMVTKVQNQECADAKAALPERFSSMEFAFPLMVIGRELSLEDKEELFSHLEEKFGPTVKEVTVFQPDFNLNPLRITQQIKIEELVIDVKATLIE